MISLRYAQTMPNLNSYRQKQLKYNIIGWLLLIYIYILRDKVNCRKYGNVKDMSRVTAKYVFHQDLCVATLCYILSYPLQMIIKWNRGI